MSKTYRRELTDPFQMNPKGWRGSVFWRKKKLITLALVLLGMVWTFGAYVPFQRVVRTKEHELQDLLHFFVAAPDEPLPSDVDPSAELSQKSLLTAAGDVSVKVPPVVVFSKTYCPYSKRAKDLLASMRIEPPPFIIEVDLRHDADLVKALLVRLTGHGTFPNVIVQRKSLGGSDDLARLSESGELASILSTAGVKLGTQGAR